jgi:hypothetical protein
MGLIEAMLWGAFGGFAMEAVEYITAIRRHRRLPWRRVKDTDPGPLAHAIAAGLRVAVGAGLACAAVRSADGGLAPWYALAIGAGAPQVLEKLTTLIPLVMRTAVQQSLTDPAATNERVQQPAQPEQGDPVPSEPEPR